MIAAFLSSGLLALGQDGLLVAANDLQPLTAASADRSGGTVHVPASPAPIVDDGREGDELFPTRQLVIAFATPDAQAFSVAILNEHGHCVRSFDFAAASRKAVPVSVDGLAQGRYVARVERDGQVRTVRFRR